jgi:hypothetical protein
MLAADMVRAAHSLIKELVRRARRSGSSGSPDQAAATDRGALYFWPSQSLHTVPSSRQKIVTIATYICMGRRNPVAVSCSMMPPAAATHFPSFAIML